LPALDALGPSSPSSWRRQSTLDVDDENPLLPIPAFEVATLFQSQGAGQLNLDEAE
jgi:hypothetical protein